MASKWILIFLMALCLSSSSSSLLSLAQISTISAAPALLPTEPPLSSVSPALSPDITPEFPTPGKDDGLSPSESSLPIIPSSPSPPNPDDMAPYGNTMAISPSGSLPASSSPVSLNSAPGILGPMMMALCLMAFWSIKL